MGKLDTIRYTYKVENGKIKIMKGTPVVIKDEMKDGFYKMIGETDTKEKAASLMTKIDKVVLWHNRLSHMSEKGMQVVGS